jgi:Thioredoxin
MMTSTSTVLASAFDRFASGLSYEKYLHSGNEEQQRRWKQVYDSAQLTATQKELVKGFVREMKILVFSGMWCGDCVEQCPLVGW